VKTAALFATVPLLGLLVAQTELARVDEAAFRAINDLGPGPQWLWDLLDPHTRNYLVLIALAVAAALVTNPLRVPSVFARVFGSALVSWGLLEAVYAVYERPRPEEIVSAASLNGHSWAHMNSFPSGHMAITAALAVATAIAFPRLRYALWAYVAAIAFSRVMFGAHFPLDAVAGTALGIASALIVARLFGRVGRVGRLQAAATADGEETPTADPLPKHAVAAVMPSYNDVPTRYLVEGVLEHVGRLVLVDDGSDPTVARQLDHIAAIVGVELVRRDERGGKGSAVRSGIDHLLVSATPPEAVIVIDADGQHPASAIPRFVAAGASADLVIGDRFGDLREMPLQRRMANVATSRLFQLTTGHAVRDTQNGMRLFRAETLSSHPAGGYEAESAHLKRVLRDGRRVSWVSMPAIYADEKSSFRAGRDSAKVIWAIVRPARRTGRERPGKGAPRQPSLPRSGDSQRAADRVKVAVADQMFAEELHVVPGACALDAFYHPFAYAAGARLCTGDATRVPRSATAEPERSI